MVVDQSGQRPLDDVAHIYKNSYENSSRSLLLPHDLPPSISVHFRLNAVLSEPTLLTELPDLIVRPLAHQRRGVSVGASQAVPQREVLAVVVVEEEVVVGVVGGAVDDAGQNAGDTVVAVVNRDGPDVDQDVQGQIEHLVQREEEGIDVVREPLQEAVNRVKGVAGEGSGDLPYVVRFVKQLWGRESEEGFTESLYIYSINKTKVRFRHTEMIIHIKCE